MHADAVPPLTDHWVTRKHLLPDGGAVFESIDTLTWHFGVAPSTRISRHGKAMTFYDHKVTVSFTMKPWADGVRRLRVIERRRDRTWQLFDKTGFPGLHGAHPDLLERLLRGMLDRLGLDAPPRDFVKRPETSASALLQGIAYPGLNGRHRSELHPALRAHREPTARGQAIAIFGVKRLRRDLVKATATAPTWALRAAEHAKAHVGVDTLVDLLRDASDGFEDQRTWQRHLRFAHVWSSDSALPYLLRALPESRRRRLLLDLAGAVGRSEGGGQRQIAIADAVRIAHDIRSWRSGERTAHLRAVLEDSRGGWGQLHDQLVDAQNRWRRLEREGGVVTLRTRALPAKHPVALALQGLETPVGVLALPRTGADLADWGEALRNCIGAYARAAEREESFLAAVLDQDGRAVAALEADPKGRIVQFSRWGNAPVTDEELAATQRALRARLRAAARAQKQAA